MVVTFAYSELYYCNVAFIGNYKYSEVFYDEIRTVLLQCCAYRQLQVQRGALRRDHEDIRHAADCGDHQQEVPLHTRRPVARHQHGALSVFTTSLVSDCGP